MSEAYLESGRRSAALWLLWLAMVLALLLVGVAVLPGDGSGPGGLEPPIPEAVDAPR